jgi:hypothetical protein
MEPDRENHDLVAIYTCEDDNEAEIIISMLEANGIEAVLDSNLPHSVLPVGGDAQILVNEADEDEARRILEEMQQEYALEDEPLDDNETGV